MASEQFPLPDEPNPFSQVLGDTLQLYRQAFAPFVAIAAIAGLISSTMSFTYTPSGLFEVLLWALIVQIPLFVAEAALIVLALQVQQGQSPNIATAYLSAFTVAAQYVAGSLLIGAVLLLGGISIVGIVAGLFLFARWGLFGPIVVMEQQSMGVALRASWRLVKGRTMRTMVMLLVVQLVLPAVSFLMQSVVGNAAPLGARIVFSTLGQAVALPLVPLFALLLYQDYLRLQSSDQPEEPQQIPPPSA